MEREELEANIATYEHLEHIRRLLRVFANALLERGETHDRSKLGDFERETFAKFTPRLKGLTYGSEEYKACLAEMAVALEHHYACNRHHPEHFKDGIDGMNLVDLVEMFIDWKASTLRHADGDLGRSIDTGRARFGMSEQLVRIFQNTAADLEAGTFGSNVAERGMAEEGIAEPGWTPLVEGVELPERDVVLLEPGKVWLCLFDPEKSGRRVWEPEDLSPALSQKELMNRHYECTHFRVFRGPGDTVESFPANLSLTKVEAEYLVGLLENEADLERPPGLVRLLKRLADKDAT